MAKGNDFEWVIAKKLSLWLTGGKDKTQLVRSVLSGGSTPLKTDAARPEYQVGDLAPNGPQGEEFRRRFAVECKNYHLDPDWWHYFSYTKWVVEDWWKKILSEAMPYKLDPLLIMRRDNRPMVVGLRDMWPFELLNGEVLHFPRLGMKVIKLDRLLDLSPESYYRFHDSLNIL